MFCPYCRNELSNGDAFCDRCGRQLPQPEPSRPEQAKRGKRRRRSRWPRILALVLLLAVIAGGVLVLQTLLKNRAGEPASPEATAEQDGGTMSTCLTPAAALTVRDSESARAALSQMQAEIGFRSMEEFSAPEVYTASPFCAYSFTQQVEGLPVDGWDLRLITNESGQVLALLNDYLPPENVTLGTAVTREQAAETVLALCPEGAELLSAGKVIFRTDRAHGEAAWKFLFLGPGEPMCYYVSAGSGQVLEALSLTLSEAASGSGSMVDGSTAGTESQPLITNYTGETYRLENVQDQIRVMDAGGVFLKEEALFWIWARSSMDDRDFYEFESTPYGAGEDPNALFTVLRNGQAEAGHLYRFQAQDGRYYLADNGSVTAYDASLEVVLGQKSGAGSQYFPVLTDSDNQWEHPYGVAALSYLEQIHSYYASVLGRSGYGSGKNFVLNVYVNAVGEGGASNTPIPLSNHCVPCFLAIYDEDCYTLEVLGHEYTHAVLHQTANLGQGGRYPEAAALDEGLSDVIGECIEAWTTGSCDWLHTGRNLRDPVSSAYPARYQGQNWLRVVPVEENGGLSNYTHTNCTVIGHLAYLMATGDLEDGANTQALGMDKLERLVYASFLWLRDDSSFDDYAGILYRCAVEMYRSGELNDRQLRCVYQAIRQVGLFPTFSKDDVGTVGLLGLDDEALENYRVTVRFLRQSDIHSANPDHYTESYRWSGEAGKNPSLQLEWPCPENAASLTPGAWGFLVELVNTEDENQTFSCFMRYYPGTGVGEQEILVPFFLPASASVAAGDYFVAALRADGTVLATGENNYGQCEVSGWTEVTALSAGSQHLVGLRADGTVLAAGWNHWGQCEVAGWTDIVAVSAGSYHTVGLRADGTVVAVGDNRAGECDVSSWTDIIAVAAGFNHTLGLRADGTVVAAGGGSYDYGQCQVSDWRDIVSIAAGGYISVGLRADGTVVAVGMNQNGECDVSQWTDIVSIATGGQFIDLGRFYYSVSNRVNTVGLRADGTVCIAGVGYTDQHAAVESWTDVVAISSSAYITAAIRSDGTLVFACDRTDSSPMDGFPLNLEEDLQVAGWTNLRTG